MGTTSAGRELGNFLAATSGTRINLIGHSQGGITINIALNQVVRRMGAGSMKNLSVHYNGAAVRETTSRNLLATAGAKFNGFSMNRGDPVPVLAGNFTDVFQILKAVSRLPVTIAGEDFGSTHTHYGPTPN